MNHAVTASIVQSHRRNQRVSIVPATGQLTTGTWQAPSGVGDGLIGYRIRWGLTQGGPYTGTADVGLVSSYTITGLVVASTYYYSVAALDSGASPNDGEYGMELSGVAA